MVVIATVTSNKQISDNNPSLKMIEANQRARPLQQRLRAIYNHKRSNYDLSDLHLTELQNRIALQPVIKFDIKGDSKTNLLYSKE